MEDRSPASAWTLVVYVKLMSNHLYIGKYLLYRIQPLEQKRDATITTSVFDVLMNVQKEIVWPDVLEPRNQKQQ